MQVSFFNKYINGINTQNHKPEEPTKNGNLFHSVPEPAKQKVYANNLCSFGVSFKAKMDEDKTIQELNNEYNWYVNHDKTRPLDAFLKIKTTEEKMNELFVDILKDETRSFALIDDIAGRARESKENYETLEKLLGKNSPNLSFYSYQNPYIDAFNLYMDKKYNEASSIDELIKLRPDWRESALVEKYAQLNNGDTDLKIGKLPNDFSDGKFEKICDYLRTFGDFSNYKSFKNIPDITIDGQTYNFEYFIQGKTDKNVYGVYTNGKKYVFKIADKSKKSLNEPYSLGVLALIDGYLTLNNCRNIAPLFYYDHNNNTSIYQYQEHNIVNEKLRTPEIINYYMPDFKALGMCYNDTVGNDNYFLSDVDCHEEYLKNCPGTYNASQKKELISVDNDHVTYSSRFMRPVSKYNIWLPNAMQFAI